MKGASRVLWPVVCVAVSGIGLRSAAAESTDARREAAVRLAIQRATDWISSIQVEPFSGGVRSLRNHAVLVEIWHRLWLIEKDPGRRDELNRMAREHLSRLLDPEGLSAVLGDANGQTTFTDLIVMAQRCREHGLDPEPIGQALRARLGTLRTEVERAPASLQLLYAVFLPAVGIDLGLSPDRLRREGLLAGRRREVDLTLADVYYLTHEVFADTDYAARSLSGLSAVEEDYLTRVLPFYTVLYLNLNNLDIAGELLTCLQAAGLRSAWAYQEGIRVLVERQNPDGSFGSRDSRSLGRSVETADYLHPTMNCLWALLLDEGSR